MESPSIVTAITASSKRDGRFVLFVDGRPFATVSVDVLDRLGVRIGAALSARQVGELQEAAAALQTYDRALALLAFQPRSARELRRRLVQKGEPAELVERAVERLVANGLLNDGEYAQQVARSKIVGQGASRRRVQQELFKRGVAREVADEAISQVMVDEVVDEGAVVERVARKKLPSLAKLDPAVRRRRLYAFLARRGYESDVIRGAMRAVLDEDVGDVDDVS